METFNGSYSANNNYVHEIENGADLDIMHGDDDDQHDLHNYLLYQHLNPPIVAEAHSQVLNNSDPNSDSYYMNGYQHHQQQEGPEVVYLDGEEDQKPDIKKELLTDENDEQLQDICIDRDFKEDDDGRVPLSADYIKCLQEAKKSSRCLLCKQVFKKLDQTIDHLQVEHFSEVYNYRYNCLNCRVAYRSSKRFNIHKTHIHNDSELFKCVDCNNKMLSKFKVYKHLLKNHQCRKSSIKFVNSRNCPRTDVENVCLDCRRVFKNVAALSNHIKSCDGKTIHEAPQDSQDNERRRSNRMVSSTSVSSTASTATKADERKVCQYCSETISSGIDRHEDNCRRKICPKCSKVFTTTRNCLRHIINIHRVSKNRVHSLWNDNVPNQTQSFNGSIGDYEKVEEEDEEEDEDVVLSVDCCTHEEIPLKRNRIG